MTKKTRIKNKIESGKIQKMEVKKGFVAGTGRRKTAIARVFLYESKGDFLINGMSFEEYFPGVRAKQEWMKPFHLVGVSHPTSQFSGTIKVEGSGKSAQLEAVIHGVSHALALMNEEFSTILRKHSMLTRDSRMVERKKPYLKKARKAPQYSKR